MYMNKSEDINYGDMGTVDTAPTKRVLWTGVAVCQPKNAITELQDNIIDFVKERLKDGSLDKKVIESSFDLGPDKVKIRWNLGIPKDRRLALLKPGLHDSEDKNSIGTWSMGGKIGIHALGDDITIRTCTPVDDNATEYYYPTGWLRDSSGEYNRNREMDWKVQKFSKDITEDNDFTEIIIKNPTSEIKNDFNPNMEENYHESMKNLLAYIGETYGLTFKNSKIFDDINFKMVINGEHVKPITYSSNDDIKNNLIMVPGFEPTWHEYEHMGLGIKILVGCTSKMDVGTGGIYFYGNHDRLFARREKNPDFLSDINVTHPQRKYWQMHIFFSGDTELIPWASPLKDGVNYGHSTMQMLKPILNKLPMPYIQLVINTHQPERFIFSEDYLNMNEEGKKNFMFNGSNMEERWERLPKIAKTGRKYDPDIIDEYDHGELTEAIKERIRLSEPKWTLTTAKKWLRSKGISQSTTKSIDQKIEALWKFNALINPTEIKPESAMSLDGDDGNIPVPGFSSPSNGNSKGEAGKDKAGNELEFDDETKEMVSGRIKKSDKMRIGIAAHSDSSTDILNFLIDLFYMSQKLLELSATPEEVKKLNGSMNEKMKAFVNYYENLESD